MNQDVVKDLYIRMLLLDTQFKVENDVVYFRLGPFDHWFNFGPHKDIIKPYILERR